MKQLRTEIEIAASAEHVWRELTDLAKYAEWNPLLPAASGEVREGARFTSPLRPASAR